MPHKQVIRLKNQLAIVRAEILNICLSDSLRIEAKTNSWLPVNPIPHVPIHFQSNDEEEISLHNPDKKYPSLITLTEAKANEFVNMSRQIELPEAQTVELLRSKNHLTKIKHYT